MNDPRSPISQALVHFDGSPDERDEIMALAYDELRRIASRFLRGERHRDSLVTTELVHEAYLRIFKGAGVSFENRKHFFASAARAMRRILVDNARKRKAGKRIPPLLLEPLEVSVEAESRVGVEILALDQSLLQLSAVDPRRAQIIELRYFAGLSEKELIEVFGLSRAAVSREVRMAKLWLRRAMQVETHATGESV